MAGREEEEGGEDEGEALSAVDRASFQFRPSSESAIVVSPGGGLWDPVPT